MEEFEWIALDDGGWPAGQALHYESRKTGDRKRQRPTEWKQKLWADGSKVYVFLGRCVECREELRAMELYSLNHGAQAVVLNICSSCQITMVAELESMQWRGKPQSAEETDEEEESPLTTADLLYRSSDYNTPKSLYMDMVEACGRVGREEDVNGRAMAARQWVIEEAVKRQQTMLKSFIATRAGMDYEYYGGDYMLYDQGRNKTITYYGDLEHHKPHGTGFMMLPEGAEYFGPFNAGLRVGSGGIFKWQDGRHYEGEWFCDKMHGQGKFTYPDGSVYEGAYMLGRQNGEGSLRLPDGSVLKGNWHNGVKEGEFWLHRPGKDRERREYLDEPPFVIADDDPISFRVKYKRVDLLAKSGTEVLDPSLLCPPPPSLLLKCQRVLGLELRDRVDRFPPDLLIRKVPRHLRGGVARELLCDAKDASTAFRDVSGTSAWQPVLSSDLSGRYLNGYDLRLMAHFLGGACPSLLSLRLVGCHIGTDGAAIIASILPTMRVLKDLNLSYNPLGKDGTALVSRSVQSHKCLRVLGLAGCKLGPKGTQALCNMLLSTRDSSLASADLSFNDMGPEGAGYISQALTRNRSLTYLNLRFNRLGPKGGTLLTDALPRNDRCLRHLVIADNHIGEHVAALLASRFRAPTRNVLAGFRYVPGATPVTVPSLSEADEEGAPANAKADGKIRENLDRDEAWACEE